MLRRLEESQEEAKRWKEEARKWEEIADNNDWAFKAAQAQLERPRHRAADAVFDGLAAIPGAGAAQRGLKAIRRRSGRG